MTFADKWERIFVVMTFLVLEAVNSYFAKAAIVGGIVPNLIAFCLFLGAIGYFLFTGPLFGRGNKDG